MESQVDFKFYKDLANQRRKIQSDWHKANRQLAESLKQKEDIEDSIDLLEDDMAVCIDDVPVDLLEYQALKSEMALMVADLKEVETAQAAIEASLEKLEEASRHLKTTMLDMKRILQNRGRVLPLKRVSDEGK